VIFRALFWVLRALFILFVIRLVLRMIFPPAARRTASRPSRPPSRVPERAGGTLARDPSCGTFVPQTSSFRVQSGGETVYFCSTACRDAWLAQRQQSGAKLA